MKKPLIVLLLVLYSCSAFSQWAVLDEEVRKLLDKINRVTGSSSSLSAFDSQAILSTDFSGITVSQPERYIGTAADCGDRGLNERHFAACMGLRNLRLKTLDQTENIVQKIQTRKNEIQTVIDSGAGVEDAGKLQRLQFNLQGIQTKLQNDAMELQALHYGYRQREKMYEMQMAEARRATDTRPPSAAGGVSLNLGPVKFR